MWSPTRWLRQIVARRIAAAVVGWLKRVLTRQHLDATPAQEARVTAIVEALIDGEPSKPESSTPQPAGAVADHTGPVPPPRAPTRNPFTPNAGLPGGGRR